MKKAICVLLAVLMLLSLTACGEDTEVKPVASAGPSNSSVSSKEDTSSVGTEISVSSTEETATSDDVTVEETVLVDEEDIRITLTGLENSIWGPEFKLLIENNSDADITVQTRNCSVNGYMVEAMLSCDVAAGKKANDSITFFETDMEANGIDVIADIELSFHVFTTDDWETYYDSELLQIRTSAADTYVYAYDDSGEELYNTNSIRIIVKGLSENDSIFGPGLLLFIENNGDQPVTIQARDTSVNGFMIDGMMSQDVLPGKRANTALTFFESDLEDNDIATIEELELSFAIFNTDDWVDIDNTEKYTITF